MDEQATSEPDVWWGRAYVDRHEAADEMRAAVPATV
jgi:hypothetical protein